MENSYLIIELEIIMNPIDGKELNLIKGILATFKYLEDARKYVEEKETKHTTLTIFERK